MATKFSIDGEAVRKLAEILNDTNLTEIEYEDNGSRIYVSRKVESVAAQVVTAPLIHSTASTSSIPSVTAVTAVNDWSLHAGAIRSPMVGTVYLASEPNAPTFVKLGDTVSIGQTLLIVEAMKVMNPIKASRAGKITQFFAKDSTPVEYGEVLLVIE